MLLTSPINGGGGQRHSRKNHQLIPIQNWASNFYLFTYFLNTLLWQKNGMYEHINRFTRKIYS